MAITAVNVGTVANDGTGDPLRDSFVTLNNNDAELESNINTVSNKTKSATTAILIAGVHTITFASPFTNAVYQLTLSVFDASGNSSSFKFDDSTQTASSFDIELFFDSKVTYIAHKN